MQWGNPSAMTRFPHAFQMERLPKVCKAMQTFAPKICKHLSRLKLLRLYGIVNEAWFDASLSIPL